MSTVIDESGESGEMVLDHDELWALWRADVEPEDLVRHLAQRAELAGGAS